MALFEIEWVMRGRLAVEADDEDEAQELADEGLSNLDVSMFDSFDADVVAVDAIEEIND